MGILITFKTYDKPKNNHFDFVRKKMSPPTVRIDFSIPDIREYGFKAHIYHSSIYRTHKMNIM